MTAGQSVDCRPVTPDRWPDLEALFGPRGACGGCWCMWWRLPRGQFEAGKGETNREALRRLVMAGEPPGLLGYLDGQPAGWCAIAPRADYPGLSRSRVLKPVDDLPVWSVTCFFVARRYRRQGVGVALLRAAVEHARERGAAVIEGYPVEPRTGAIPDAFAWTGTPRLFVQAGFEEVLRRSPTRPIMRWTR
jgi:GNAT superfamily N-acetyltransferase